MNKTLICVCSTNIPIEKANKIGCVNGMSEMFLLLLLKTMACCFQIVDSGKKGEFWFVVLNHPFKIERYNRQNTFRAILRFHIIINYC